MEKLFIEKDEPIGEIIEKLLSTEDREVVLVIPKQSRIVESPSNFRLLAREAEVLGKEISIESVDDEVRALASASDIKATHPLFEKNEKLRSLSDILPRQKKKQAAKSGEKKDAYFPHSIKKEPRTLKGKIHQEEDWRVPESLHGDDTPDSYAEESEKESGSLVVKKRSRRRIHFPFRKRYAVIAIIAAVILALGGWFGSGAISKAKITLQFKKVPWSYEAAFSGSVAYKEFNAEKNLLPIQLFEMEKSITQMFPATGKNSVSRKATGIMTIYNAFSSDPQVLVATTRFLAPDGKLFRLDEKVTVPGAYVKNGEIIPSSIKAKVTSDRAGEEYNVGPITRLSIPGFKGSSRYEGFYGALESGTSGGFVGVAAVPTEEDISKAKKSVEGMFRAAFQTLFLDAVPEGFIALPEATSFDIKRLVVNENTDENGNFSILGSALFRAFAFKKDDVGAVLTLSAQDIYGGSLIQDLSVQYSSAVPDFVKKTISMQVAASGVLAPVLDENILKEKIKGMREESAGVVIRALPNLLGATISISPSWTRSIPSDIAKITIVAE